MGIRGRFGVSFLCVVIIAALSAACQNSGGRSSGPSTVDQGGGAYIPPYGQAQTPPSIGDPKSGSGDTASPLLAPGTKDQQSDINNGQKPADGKPLEAPDGFDYHNLLRNLGGIGPFDPHRLPDPSFLNFLYCAVAAKYPGRDISTVYDYIEALYLDTLGRLPETDGMNFWVGQVHNLYDAGNRYNVAWAILNSDESRKRIVTIFYWTFLHRAPDDGGLAYWVNQLAQGSRVEDVMAGFMGSWEYFANRAGQNPWTLIALFYHEILGREAAPWEVQYWVNVYSSYGGNDAARVQVAKQIIDSDEGRLKFIQLTYQAYLGRNPDPAGYQSWLGALKGGQNRLQVQAGILASDEYLNRQGPRFHPYTLASFCQNLPH